MNNLIVSLVLTILFLIAAAILGIVLFRDYQRIRSQEQITDSQKRILAYQLLSISLWTIAAVGILLYPLWPNLSMDRLSTRPLKIIIAIMNWVFFGFFAFTSIIARVSVVSVGSSIRSWNLRGVAKGRDAILIGIAILALLAYWTWKDFLPNL